MGMWGGGGCCCAAAAAAAMCCWKKAGGLGEDASGVHGGQCGEAKGSMAKRLRSSSYREIRRSSFSSMSST